MRFPHFLPDNGTIGFLAPSFGCAIEPYETAFKHALKKWDQEGYKTVLGPNCFANEGVGISNTPKKCGEEVNESFLDEKSDVLISCGGGELMCEVLDYIDFESIKKNEPKWYMGYSDNTNLTFLLPTLCDTAAVYGPCASYFGAEPRHESVTDAFELLKGNRLTVKSYDLWEREQIKSPDNPLCSFNLTEKREHTVYYDGRIYKTLENQDLHFKFQGRLIGGCMDCLINLLGTQYDKVNEFNEKYKEDGFIWFIEACDLNVFSIRRAMWQMEHAGWFRYVKGFMFGRPGQSESMMGLDEYEAVFYYTRKYNVPVIMDMDIGHMPPMMPLIVGAVAEVEINGNEATVNMKLE